LIDTTVHSGRKLEGPVNLKVASRKQIVYTDGKIIHAYLREHYRIVNGKNASPLFHITKFNGKKCKFAEGSISKDGLVLGCSLYSLFDTSIMRGRVIEYLASKKGIKVSMHGMDATEFYDEQIQQFSKIIKNNTNMKEIMELVGLD
jgi:cobyric acid synthase